MKHRTNGVRRVLVPAIAMMTTVWLSACGSDSSTSSTLPTTLTLVTDTFNGTLGQNESKVHTFTVTNSGYTLLAGFTTLAPASITALGVGIGTWDGSTSSCSLNVTQNDAAKSGSTGLSGTPGSGSYCLRVYDGGNVPAGTTASYTVQIQHY